MTTPELLKKATKRPWRQNSRHIISSDGSSVALVRFDSDAELIVRAVNSFEAMRDALSDALPCLEASQPAKGGRTDQACEKIRKALALAEKEGE